MNKLRNSLSYVQQVKFYTAYLVLMVLHLLFGLSPEFHLSNLHYYLHMYLFSLHFRLRVPTAGRAEEMENGDLVMPAAVGLQ